MAAPNAAQKTVVTSSGSSPTGVISAGPRNGQVPTARTTVGTTAARAPPRPTGHQRRDGIRPSGNSSTRNTQASRIAPGRGATC
jgi:hypothetical protein